MFQSCAINASPGHISVLYHKYRVVMNSSKVPFLDPHSKPLGIIMVTELQGYYKAPLVLNFPVQERNWKALTAP